MNKVRTKKDKSATGAVDQHRVLGVKIGNTAIDAYNLRKRNSNTWVWYRIYQGTSSAQF